MEHSKCLTTPQPKGSHHHFNRAASRRLHVLSHDLCTPNMGTVSAPCHKKMPCILRPPTYKPLSCGFHSFDSLQPKGKRSKFKPLSLAASILATHRGRAMARFRLWCMPRSTPSAPRRVSSKQPILCWVMLRYKNLEVQGVCYHIPFSESNQMISNNIRN